MEILNPYSQAITDRRQAMNPQNFVVIGRSRFAEITEFPTLDFADYEQRLTSLQGVLQLIQKAYLGTPPKRFRRRNLICKPRKNRRAHVNHYSSARVSVIHRGRGCERKSWVCFERGLVRGVSVSL